MSIGRKTLSVFSLVFAVAAFSTFAAAQTDETKKEGDQTKVESRKQGKQNFWRGEKRGFRGRGHHGKRGSHRLMRSLRTLELSEGQNAQIKSIMETHKTGQQPYREEMRSLRMKFRDGTATEGDRARMKELKDQSRAASDQLRSSILSVLTPGQLEQLEQMKAERKRRMEERRQYWRERRKQQSSDPPAKTDN